VSDETTEITPFETKTDSLDYLLTNANLYAEWRDNASCDSFANSEDPEVASEYANAWIQEDHPKLNDAVQICMECPVRALCVKDASTEEEVYGLRGGFFFIDGRLVSRDRATLHREFGLKVPVRQVPRKNFVSTVAQEHVATQIDE
jgi:hypothetical protein